MKHKGAAMQKSPEQVWTSLSEKAQFALVRRITDARGKQLMARYHQILSIGVGYKTKGGEVHSTVCVGFLVKRKVKRMNGAPVPNMLLAYVQSRGKRLRCHVPTDVEELGSGGKPHMAANVALGVTAISASTGTSRIAGGICCVAQEIGGDRNRYLLGCHHVLALSKVGNTCTARPAVVRDTATGIVVGTLFEAAPLAAGGAISIDAAIAIVPPGTDVTWKFGTRPVRPVRIASSAMPPTNCSIYSPREVIPIPSIFVKQWSRVPLDYPCGTVVIETAYQFRAVTKEGDSGSAVMSPDGMLYGMHFWGNTVNEVALAIPAYVLFRAGLFSAPLSLA